MSASKIGNYSQYIADYKQCGLSRNTFGKESPLDSNGTRCFEYNHEISDDLKDARAVESGEAPWVVFLAANAYVLGFIPGYINVF